MKRLIILLVAIISVLICISPIVAAENNVLSDFVLFDFNPFGGDSPSFDIKDLEIERIKSEHTNANGNVDKSNKYFLKFKVDSKSDWVGNYTLKVVCYDKNKKEVKTVVSYVDKKGDFKIPLTEGTHVKSVNVTIKDGDKLLYNNSTSKVKITENITKDEPKQESSSTSSSSSSSSSGQTYWASSNSGKFHYPSCEWGQKISGKNKVVFNSREQAINAGYAPCQVCSP